MGLVEGDAVGDMEGATEGDTVGDEEGAVVTTKNSSQILNPE